MFIFNSSYLFGTTAVLILIDGILAQILKSYLDDHHRNISEEFEGIKGLPFYGYSTNAFTILKFVFSNKLNSNRFIWVMKIILRIFNCILCLSILLMILSFYL